MSLPTRPAAGPALPIKVSTSAPQGKVAYPCYRYTVAPTDGRAVQGGPALPVKVITAADLVAGGGTYQLIGTPFALPVYVETGTYPVQDGEPIAVYYIN